MDPTENQQNNLFSYLKSNSSYWYWLTLLFATLTTLTAFFIPTTGPTAIIRNILGLAFTVWLPGYSLMRALFPISNDPNTKTIDQLERIALSIGTSFALLSIIGLILNYTPWGITTTSIVLTIYFLTAAFASIGIWREHRGNKRSTPNR